MIAVIVAINKIIFDSVNHSSVAIDDIKKSELSGHVLTIIDGDEDYVRWTGEYGDMVKVDGIYCSQISSIINQDGLMFFFKKNLMETIELLKGFYEQEPDFAKTKAINNP